MQAAQRVATLPLPRRLRTLIVSVSVAGTACVVWALGTALTDSPPTWWLVASMVALVILSRIGSLQLRIGSNTSAIDWGEAALVYGLVELDPPWVVLATAVGTACVFALRVNRVKATFNVGAAVISTSLACLVLAATVGAKPDPLSVSGAAALILAAATYSIAADALTSCAVGFARSIPVLEVFADGIGMKAVPFAGNVMAAFGLFAVAAVNPFLLAVVPPAVWLLHQGYAGRVRARTEREAWQELALATHALNTLNARNVVDAAVVGAARLFGADVVEVEYKDQSGATAEVRGNASGEITWGPLPLARPEPMVEEVPLPGPREGVLRLCFRSAVVLSERERLTLATFVESFAAGLRNAEVHEQLQELAERKAHEAEHDALTGLASRSYLMEAGGRTLDRTSGYVALLLLDLDHFHEVNDTLGHDAGDELLRSAGDRLNAIKRPDEILARLGGDEFALFTPAPSELDGRRAIEFAGKRAAAMLAAVGEPIHLGQIWWTAEARVGVAVTANGGESVAELLRRAEVAMYQAKRSPHPVMSYDPAKDPNSLDRLALVAEMQTALEQTGQLVLDLQPSIDLATGAPLGAEALVRWQHPRRGLLKPGDFITQIEQTDLIGPLTSEILDLAVAACVSWEANGLKLPVAVNLSARSLLDRDLPRRVAKIIKKHRIEPDRLVLEITETAMMSELEVVEEIVDELRVLGVQLSLDDFGTGHSSLSFLARVKVEEVKIDKGFVAKMHESVEAAAIVRTTIELARSLGLRVIAEGVENADQHQALAQLGCTGAQGYHLYPPMAPEKARDAMRVAAQSAAKKSTATVIPLGPKRAPWLGRRRPDEGDPLIDDPTVDESASSQD
jgi:diguanylate cyclase